MSSEAGQTVGNPHRARVGPSSRVSHAAPAAGQVSARRRTQGSKARRSHVGVNGTPRFGGAAGHQGVESPMAAEAATDEDLGGAGSAGRWADLWYGRKRVRLDSHTDGRWPVEFRRQAVSGQDAQPGSEGRPQEDSDLLVVAEAMQVAPVAGATEEACA